MKKIALWSPTKEQIDNANMTKFRNFINLKYKIKLENYFELYDWSITYIANFWDAVWEFMDIIHSKAPSAILTHINSSVPKEDITNYRWFKGAKLNFAENLLRYSDEEPAIVYIPENQPVKRLSYKELYDLTAKCAFGLKKLGIKKGDRVAGFISNNPEAVIAMLAAASIGAIWTSTSPDFGVQGVVDRFSQVEPHILIAVDGYYYNGKEFSTINTIEEVAKQIPLLQNIVIINQIGTNIEGNEKYMSWEKLLDNKSKEIDFEQVEFDHPVYIMYSSGTTGVPKCIVHSTGGTLIQHFKELVLHTNLTDLDIITYFTTCGWMMWNWLVSSLSVGAAIVLIDGNPAYPNLERLWKIIEDENITVFGTSPKFLSSCQKAGLEPKTQFDLSELKIILSTGSPLNADNFEWVYSHVKSDVQLSSISGGTDIISCFMLGNPVLPVYSEEIQCRGLGMKVESWNEEIIPVIGEKGELVCTAPFPSMPVYFWNDPDDEKYEAAYFEYFPGVWRHGDFITITENGGVIVYGRSDATLNPGGIRIGTAEIYRIAESLPEILDSIVVGIPFENDIKIALFVVLKDGFKYNESLESKIKSEIKSQLTPRHVPQIIKQISEVPVTLNNKKVELAVLKTLLGEEVKNKSAIANPDSLKQFEGMKFD